MATPRISSAEWEVMNVIWEKNPVTAGEVFEALGPGRGWVQKTVNTFLARLVDKKALAVSRRSKINLYRPLVAREACVAEEGDSFLQRVFRGAAGPLVLHFVERAELTEDELDELQRLLREKGRQP